MKTKIDNFLGGRAPRGLIEALQTRFGGVFTMDSVNEPGARSTDLNWAPPTDNPIAVEVVQAYEEGFVDGRA